MEQIWSYLICINLLGLLLMGVDKRNAAHRQDRVPEIMLMLAALMGGSLGGTLGMIAFRHKTKKPMFSMGFPVILILQLAIVLWKLV